MPQKLFDSDGNEVEVPTSEEFDALKTEREEQEVQLKALEEGSPGIKSLRDAIKRKDSAINELSAKLKGVGEINKPEEKQEEHKSSQDDIAGLVRSEASKTFVDIEVNRSLNGYTEEERGAIKRYFVKLTTGEDVTIENFDSFLKDAERLAIPKETRESRGTIGSGRPPHKASDKKSFDQTDEGQALGSRLGLNLGKK
jgi:hypothetical protein